MRTVCALIIAVSLCASIASAQDQTSRVTVTVTADGRAIQGVNVRSGPRGALTGANGSALLVLPSGTQKIRASLIGYAPDSLLIDVVAGKDTTVALSLHELAAEITEVVVNSARIPRRIEDEPTRVEALSGEDVAEKTEMRPQDLTGFLSEMPGVRIQTTSAASGAAAVRLQGLRPRYTLMLADGLPLYGGTSTGLDLLQLPPADLKQIEVVKGPASALYGASALGGTINLISKRPGNEADLLVQGTNHKGANAFLWKSKKVAPSWGYTLVGGAHYQDKNDTDDDGWADLSGVRRAEVRPRLFFDLSSATSLFVTAGGTIENRTGGFMPGRLTPDHGTYTERFETRRADIGAVERHSTGGAIQQLQVSANVNRSMRRFGSSVDHVTRGTAFGDLSYSRTLGKHDVLIGGAVEADDANVEDLPDIDYTFVTSSVFGQDTWQIAPRFAITGSERLDHHSRYGTRLSSRWSALARVASGWTARLSGSTGYYAPTPFMEETDAVSLNRVRNFGNLREETATYGSFDINGKAGPFELNGSVFGSRIRHPVIGVETSSANGSLVLFNAEAAASTRGAEFFTVYDAEPLLVTLLYTYTNAREPLDFDRSKTARAVLVPRHTGGVDITWEEDETGTWIALEAFYTGTQRLTEQSPGGSSSAYAVVGLFASQRIGRFKGFVNVENIGNTRMTSRQPLILTARTPTGRWTIDPWGPLEGRVISAGLRISSGDLARRAY